MNNDDKEILEPCPFCGGASEIDTSRGFNSIVTGRMETQVAIYCTDCGAEMSICKSDNPDWHPDDIAAHLTMLWNTRTKLTTSHVVDEREAFERMYLNKMGADISEHFEDGDYEQLPKANLVWEGWQARAKLSQQVDSGEAVRLNSIIRTKLHEVLMGMRNYGKDETIDYNSLINTIFELTNSYTKPPQPLEVRDALKMADDSLLRQALESIAHTAKHSRTQTNRLRWIEAKARTALEGKDMGEFVGTLPKNLPYSERKPKA